MTADKCREAFEKWSNKNTHGQLSNTLWTVWQAAWNARTPEVTREEVLEICQDKNSVIVAEVNVRIGQGTENIVNVSLDYNGLADAILERLKGEK